MKSTKQGFTNINLIVETQARDCECQARRTPQRFDDMDPYACSFNVNSKEFDNVQKETSHLQVLISVISNPAIIFDAEGSDP
jgi:hypothetical protein